MEIEQGTPVADFRVEPLLNTDLPDPRLPRAFRAWNEFKRIHQPLVAGIGNLQPQELAFMASDLSSLVRQAISIEVEEYASYGSASEEKIAQLNEVISGAGNRIIFMRHGEQSPPEWIFSISHPGLRKIRMMQDPFNREDLMTNKALVEAFITAFFFLHIQEKADKRIHILSSGNMRAREIGQIISTVIYGSNFLTEEGLSCITYGDERDNPPVVLEDLLADLPSGIMPWDPELVDKWCKVTRSGVRQSEAIIKTVEALIKNGTDRDGNDIFLALTHSQQLAEVLRFAGRLANPYVRFPELTMIALSGQESLQIFPRGVLVDQNAFSRRQLSFFN